MNAPGPDEGRRLRVAVLNRVFSPTGGGAETYSIRLVEALSAQCEMHVFAQDIAHSWPGVTYHRIACPMRKPRWINQLWYAWATWRATSAGFDVVHSHENTWHGQIQTVHVKPLRHNLLVGRVGLARALRWLKIGVSPRLLTYIWLEGARFQRRPGRAVVVTSDMLRADVLAAYPQCAGMLHTVTPGVILPPAGSSPSKRSARESLGLPAQGPLLLFVANDYARKGLGALLQATSSLPADVQLAVVGKADQIGAFRDRARALGHADRVHFLGPRHDMAAIYPAADVLVHPTLEDTFAMVVLEAMAHGVPVVVSGSRHCGISALLHDGHDALLVEQPEDPAALAVALSRLLSDPILAASVGARGHEFATAHSWERAARDCLALYRAALTPPA